MPRCIVEVDHVTTGLTSADLVDRLWNGDPRIAVKQAGDQSISMTPDTLSPGDESIITERLRALLVR
jgi:hypothetical protein